MYLSHEDFFYELPASRIAHFPVEPRDHAKLLIFDGQIRHDIFKNFAQHLDNSYTLFFNNTKVIPARLFFRKATGALIEIFLLHPTKSQNLFEVMNAKNTVSWACAIGNLKRLKQGDILENISRKNGKVYVLRAKLEHYEQQEVSLSWEGEENFAQILEHFGQIPLPPYLKRQVEEHDKQNYQTIYGQKQGAVAAPTAGLHFTESVLESVTQKGIKTDFLTLHVAGGTFQPIREQNVWEHQMHSEQIVVSKKNLENILQAQKIAAVGTTSMRTLESLYWYGVQILEKGESIFHVSKLSPYQERKNLPHSKEAIGAILELMQSKNWEEISGNTEIMIVPSYHFRLCEALLTNFHLPSTTLMLLVAAFVGESWREIYQTALEKDYRFLSFGDASLLFRQEKKH